MDGQSWFFNPFAWQFLFTIGAALAMLGSAHSGALPRVKWLAWLCGAYLVFAFLSRHHGTRGACRTSSRSACHHRTKRISAFCDSSTLALAYLVFSSVRLRAFAGRSWLQPLEACGRHSLEVFAAGCVLALFGRLVFRTGGAGFEMQIAVNMVGLATTCLVGWWLERRRHAPVAQIPIGEPPRCIYGLSS